MKKSITVKAKTPLNKILSRPDLPALVQALPPSILLKLVNQIGLEDAAEVIHYARTEQLEEIFDEDLWYSSRPGQAEAFDPDRFALWLHVISEAGLARAAERITELDEEIVSLGLSRNLLVLDLDRMTEEMEGRGRGGELIEKAMESSLSHEFDSYGVFSLNPSSWDTILNLLIELDSNHHSYLSQQLERLCAISSDYVEDNGGLYHVLTRAEALTDDAVAARDDRRLRKGFVPQASAAGFLKLIEAESLDQLVNEAEPDTYTKEYFCAYDPAKPTAPSASSAALVTTSQKEIVELLVDAEVLQAEEQPALLSGALDDSPKSLLAQALEALRSADPTLHARRMEETAYLANILIAGMPNNGRRLRPAEAGDLVIESIWAGASHLGKTKDLEAMVREVSFVKLFRVGWKTLS